MMLYGLSALFPQRLTLQRESKTFRDTALMVVGLSDSLLL